MTQLGANLALQRIERAEGPGELGTALIEMRSPSSKVRECSGSVSVQVVADPIIVHVRPKELLKKYRTVLSHSIKFVLIDSEV